MVRSLEALDYPPEEFLYLKHEFSRLNEDIPAEFERSTYDDFVSENAHKSFILDPDYDFGRSVEIMSETKFFEQIDQLGGWDKFNEIHPEHCGHLALSAVGFNEVGTQAAVFLSGMGGGEWCLDEYLLLQKLEGEWQATGEAWMAIC
jgi:hypothetical protein